MKDLYCPKCRSRIYISSLTSNPPQFECTCSKCKFWIRAADRENAILPFTQEELDNFYPKTFKDIFDSFLPSFGSALYGKECWFPHGDDTYWSRVDERYLSTEELLREILRYMNKNESLFDSGWGRTGE